MPGFEAISVVLAVIPLFISAAEHYRDGLNSINRLWKKERILQKYIEDLSIQRTLLDEFSQSLLIDVDLDISVKVQLLEDVNGDVWNQPAVKRKLDATLGPVRNAFTTLLQRIDQALISQLADESMIRYKGETINTQRTTALSSLLIKIGKGGPCNGRELWDRLKFTWKEPKRNEVLQEIKECNNTLGSLLTALNLAKSFHREKQHFARAGAVFRVRSRAQHLYHALSCHCNCPTKQEVKLCLRRSYHTLGPSEDVCFEALLLHSPDDPCECRIRVLEPDPNKPLPILTDVDTAKTRERKALQEICAASHAARERNLRLELLIDPQTNLWEDTTEENPTRLITSEFVTLERLLSQFPQYYNKRWLAKEKAILAVVLAHSLLQLHESEWLHRYWSKRHISFLRDRGFNFTKSARFNLERPYVSTKISRFEAPCEFEPANDSISLANHPVPSLLALGVLLLELHLNSSIDVEPTNLRSHLLELLHECGDDITMVPSYHQVICFCIYLSPLPPTRTSRSFDNAGFRDWYYHQVIEPLEDILHENFEVGQEDWDRF